MESENGSVMLQIEHLEVSYRQDRGLRQVLHELSFDLRKGEIVSLLGESGSGKSTIAKALIGLLPDSANVTSGALKLDEQDPVPFSHSGRMWNRIRGPGIAMLFQDARLALNPMMRIGDHFRETLHVHRIVPKAEMEDISEGWLARLGFAEPKKVLRAYPHELSGGMCQRICLALALCLRPQVLIADEPTSALDSVNQREVLDLMRNLQQELGLSVLLITHDLTLAESLSHRVLVLEKGRIVESGTIDRVLKSPQHRYTRQLIAARRLSLEVQESPSAASPGLLELHNLVKSHDGNRNVLSGVNLCLHDREIIGILGQSGCGKSTLARCIMGLDTVDTGIVRFRDQEITHMKGRSRRRLARHMQLVFQDARASLNPRDSALELVQTMLHTFRVGSRNERSERAKELLDAVGITGDGQHRRPPQLSTGQCQRVAIARALALKPELLVCDEAVSALDMSVQAQILELLLKLHKRFGFSILMISHDVRVLRAFCHRIAVMHEGTFIELLPGDELMNSEHPHTRLLLDGAGGKPIRSTGG